MKGFAKWILVGLLVVILTAVISFFWGRSAASRRAGTELTPTPVAMTATNVEDCPRVFPPERAESVTPPKTEPVPVPVKSDPPKSDPVRPTEPTPKAESDVSNNPKIEPPTTPVFPDKSDPCEKVWATAVVVKLPFGGLTAVLLDSDGNCSAIVSTAGLVSDGAIMKPLKVIGGGEERFRVHVYASSSEVLRNANGNQFGIVDISGLGKKISIGDNSGSILLIIATKQEFEIGDARSFVVRYLEWIRRHPLGIESDKPIELAD